MSETNDVVRLKVIKEKPHISYSEWVLFNSCQWRWYLDYVLEKRSKTVGIDLSFGTVLHSCLEMIKNKKIEDRISISQAKEKFEKELLAEHEKINGLTKKPYDLALYMEAGNRILDHVESVDELREAEVVWNEFELFEDIDRNDEKNPIKFKGFIDFVIRVPSKNGKKSLLYICDFKTCSWGWNFKKKTDPLVTTQLLLYKHFVCKKFGLDPKDVKTFFILLKKKPAKNAPVIEFLPCPSGPQAVEDAIEVFQRDITAMKSGELRKNRDFCKNQYGDICPYFDTPECVVEGEQKLI